MKRLYALSVLLAGFVALGIFGQTPRASVSNGGGGGGGTGCVTTGTAKQILVDDGAGGCTSATPTISGSTITASLTGHASLDLPLTGGTLTGNLLFTDATYDIGASGATRPRDFFLSRNASMGGTLGVTGLASFTAGLASGSSPPSLTAGTGGADAYGEGTVPSVCAAAAVDCVYADSTQHALLASYGGGSYFPLGRIIAFGSTALDFPSTAPGACASPITASATGAASTDVILFNGNASIMAVTGYVPASTGGFSIEAYPTTNTVNFKCGNWTAGTVDPGSITVNWMVLRK